MYQRPIRSDEIYHYGIKRRSGRYPYGSGDRPYQDLKGFQRNKIKESRRKLEQNRKKNYQTTFLMSTNLNIEICHTLRSMI